MLARTKPSPSPIGGTSQRGADISCFACYVLIKESSCGPVVEQGTHFCDLSRYFGGDVDIDSVVAHSVEWDEVPGRLSKMSIDESLIKPENRVPRITSATW